MKLTQKIVINSVFTSGNRKDERGICTHSVTLHTCRKKTEISKGWEDQFIWKMETRQIYKSKPWKYWLLGRDCILIHIMENVCTGFRALSNAWRRFSSDIHKNRQANKPVISFIMTHCICLSLNSPLFSKCCSLILLLLLLSLIPSY